MACSRCRTGGSEVFGTLWKIPSATNQQRAGQIALRFGLSEQHLERGEESLLLECTLASGTVGANHLVRQPPARRTHGNRWEDVGKEKFCKDQLPSTPSAAQ